MKRKRNPAKNIFLAAAAVMIFGFYGSFWVKPTQMQPIDSAEPTVTATPAVFKLFQPKEYLVVYCDQNDNQLYDCLVEDGKLPEGYQLRQNGLAVKYWTDKDGNRVDVTATPITDDVYYYAVFAPELCTHEPYLFPNSYGLIDPEGYMTYGTVETALRALVQCGEDYLPFDGEYSQPESNMPLSEIKTLLDAFCGTESVQYPADEYLTRREFARIINFVSGRNEELVTASASAVSYPDIGPEDADYAAVMEAACPHTEGGKTWAEQNLHCDVSGFAFAGGKLYYINENGTAERDCDIGLLHFNEKGIHTSGSEELDALVSGLIVQFQNENPDADREALLRAAYNYCRDSFKYLSRHNYEFGETGWEVLCATEMLSTLKGDCYNYAAAFWALSRGLGYDSVAVSGTISKTFQPHGWVIMKFDDDYFYFDCETEMTYIQKGQTRDMFKMSKSYYVNWSYKRQADLGI